MKAKALVLAIALCCLSDAVAQPRQGVRSRIPREPVKSHSIAAVGYSNRLQILEVEFKSGGIYRYVGVPASVYRRMLASDSKGRFYQLFIRGRYKSTHVKPAGDR